MFIMVQKICILNLIEMSIRQKILEKKTQFYINNNKIFFLIIKAVY